MRKYLAFITPALTLIVCVYCTVTKQRDQQPAPRVRALELSAPPVPLQSQPKNETEVYLYEDSGVIVESVEEAPVVSYEGSNTESYKGLPENEFTSPLQKALSTFSIDVDRASYSNIRRFIEYGEMPPPDAVRIEEMINYFTYDYPQPKDEHPFAVSMEVSQAPWNDLHQVVHIGIQGKNLPTATLPASNLVFLIDVSGSMDEANKLPLVKSSFTMLVNQLRPKDHVSIVVYAGAAGTVLEPTSGAEKRKILDALDRLTAGGSTAGAEGLRLAYQKAREHYQPDGNNRVIIATDGDFNVGESSDEAMEDLISEKRKDGIFLTVLGFGMGNYKDSKMEILADKGNGDYGYIDNINEARKMFINEFGGTLFTIAKDVKIQVEFNPAKVQAYRLLGYENRLLRDEDFNDDKKDAGDLGAGHTVTALYEIIPTGVKSSFYDIDSLKYQKTAPRDASASSDELLTLKLRYHSPQGSKSVLMTETLAATSRPFQDASKNLRWASAVASFGMILKHSEYINDYSVDKVVTLAESAKGKDEEGYRAEFISLVKSCGSLARR